MNNLSGYSKPFQVTHILPGIDDDRGFRVGPGGQLLVEILGRKTWTDALDRRAGRDRHAAGGRGPNQVLDIPIPRGGYTIAAF